MIKKEILESGLGAEIDYEEFRYFVELEVPYMGRCGFIYLSKSDVVMLAEHLESSTHK